MAEPDTTTAMVVLRVQRFLPKQERDRSAHGSPFSKPASPFTATAAPSSRRVRGRHWTQDYTLRVHPFDTLLDCLLTVKRTIDPTLAFRYSCGHGMCGSDAVAVNGTPTLLCTATIGDWAKAKATAARPLSTGQGFRRTGASTATSTGRQDAEHQDAHAQPSSPGQRGQAEESDADLGVIELGPLPGFSVQRDLIADTDPMLEQIKKLKPYLQADGVLATTNEGKVDVFEYLQRPEQLARYELLSNCIACGVCEGSCPVFAGGDAFIGPAALIAASRFINDSRDTAHDERLDAIGTPDGIAACQSVRACSRQCPRGIDVGEEMWQLVSRTTDRDSPTLG